MLRHCTASLLALVAVTGAPCSACGQDSSEDDFPITGKAGPGLERFDGIMRRLQQRHGFPGAALAIAKDGKLVLIKGYGFADLETDKPVRPEAIFGLASVSKTFTAVAILRLVEQGKLRLNDRAFELLRLKPLPDDQVDPRLYQITIRQLLNHSGGWNREKSGDPLGWSRRVARRLNVRLPVSPRQLARYMLGQPLDFDPGTQGHYSNFGFTVLGLVLEHVTEESYEEAVRHLLLDPLHMRSARLPNLEHGYQRHEAHRYDVDDVDDKELPARILPVRDPSGGWTASAVDLAWFLTALDGSRGKPFLSKETIKEMLAPPPAPLAARESYFGLGWHVFKTDRGVGYSKDGGLLGIRAFIQHTPPDIDWVALFNGGDDDIVHNLRVEMDRALPQVAKWPDVDYFKEYRHERIRE
jgi:N-acyl-D-amino-acid deacylase